MTLWIMLAAILGYLLGGARLGLPCIFCSWCRLRPNFGCSRRDQDGPS